MASLPGRSGAISLWSTIAIATLTVWLFGFSPRLNPLDILSGHLFDVAVPRVVGMSQPQSLLKIESSELQGRVEFAYSAKIARGSVIAQSPRAYALVRRESEVVVTVSRGPAIGPMPNLIGKTEEEANALLADFEFDVHVDRAYDETIPTNQVHAQNPAAGTIVVGGSRVAISVSLGPQQRTVPDINSVTIEGAAFLLGKAGLTIGQTIQADSDTVPLGGVLGSDPPAGTVVDRDTAINLLISAGRPPVSIANFVGQQQSKAADTLTKQGFLVGEITQIGAVNDPNDGKVTAQTPNPGTTLRPGEVVTLTVIRATPPPPPPTTIPPPPTVTTSTTTTIPPPIESTTTTGPTTTIGGST